MNIVVAGNMLTNVRRFIILQSGEDLISFNKDKSANFSNEKKKIKLSECLLLEPENMRTNFKSNRVLEYNGL